MKNLLFLFLVLALGACNQFNPNDYPSISKETIRIVATKMQKMILPKANGIGNTYWADFDRNTLSGAIVEYNCDDKVFNIDVSTLDEGPGLTAYIDIDSTGKIIRAYGYTHDSASADYYYSETWKSNPKTPEKAKRYYRGVARKVVDYIKNYSKP